MFERDAYSIPSLESEGLYQLKIRAFSRIFAKAAINRVLLSLGS
jgi:hypothetical protein